MTKIFTYEKYGLELQLNKFAAQADGAAWLKQGGTVVLATACSAESAEFPGFLPLSVDYREQFSAAGKIPGGYLKREGKSSDKEVLVSRLIDRTIRPLFPDYYFEQVQILATVLSAEEKHSPYALSLLASSVALTISKIPFMGPVGAVEVGRIDGQLVFFPSYAQSKLSDLQMTVAGNKDGICMVEGSINQMSEHELVEILFKAHAIIKDQVNWQLEIAQEMAVVKTPLKAFIDWQEWQRHTVAFLTADRIATLFSADKQVRSAALALLKSEFLQEHEATIADRALEIKVIDYVFEDEVQKLLTQRILSASKRVDGRSFTEVRPISIEVGLLPMVHGSALFNRGKTQALVTVTLGGGQDEQRVEDIYEDIKKRFMLHYNFPPFSVGEVRPQRGPGRREIGHGYLAISAIKQVLPDKEQFPYTIRIIADLLG
ncbi:polyribonucleotide nucleotidyltransferase, partial [Candidatus Dependentiae bacterium]|nr:polyribonucleotide nucleotidyltransferase [Candidatus Dependentiae bacterium]